MYQGFWKQSLLVRGNVAYILTIRKCLFETIHAGLVVGDVIIPGSIKLSFTSRPCVFSFSITLAGDFPFEFAADTKCLI